MPSRPGEFHPEPLTDPHLNLSIHPARVTARRLPPSAEPSGSSRYDPVGPSSTAMTHPLRSTGITPLQRYYEAIRPWPAHRYFQPRGWSRLCFFPWHRRVGSHVPYGSPVEIRAAYMPDAAWFANDVFVADVAKLKALDVAAGDGVFVLGFPMGLAGMQRNYVIVRQGGIARISEMLDKASKSFMIDAFVFPGNSGGPVILRPELSSIMGTKKQTPPQPIGLVLSYKPYSETAFSAQTPQPRIIFQENSGLAEVLPTDYIQEAIEAWRQAS